MTGEWTGRVAALEERLRAAEAEGRVAEELRGECRRLAAEKEGLKEEMRENAAKYDALVDELNELHDTIRRLKEENESYASGECSGDDEDDDEDAVEYRDVTLTVPVGARVTIDLRAY